MPTQSIAETIRSDRYRTGGLIALCLVMFFCSLGSNRALTYHEVLTAGPARQMVASGDWIVPMIGDHSWTEKPPLHQWLTAISALLCGGFTEWTVRLPFALAAVVVVLLTVRLMTLLFDARIGWLSGVVQATSVYMVMYARLAEPDILLLALVMAAVTVFHEVETRYLTLNLTQLHRWRLTFWVLLGLMNLAKGIAFGPVLTLCTCGGWLLLKRDWYALRRWWSPVGMVLALAIAIAWPLAVVWKEPEALQLWQRHLFGRAAGTFGYQQPPWYYLLQWPLQMLPWTPFLILAAPRSIQAARQAAGSDRFCWWWFVGQLALLSCSSGKHHHYLIYALPALSPLVAQGLIRSAERLRTSPFAVKPLALGIASMAVLGVIGGVMLGFIKSQLQTEAWLLVPSLGCGLLVLAFFVARRQPMKSGATLLGLIVWGHTYAQVIVMPRVDATAADKRFLAQVEQKVASDRILAACGSQEMAQHLFYLQRPVVGIWNPADLPKTLPTSREIYVIARGHAETELAALGQVERIMQSEFSRREKSRLDRFTLFRVDRSATTPLKFAAANDNGDAR